MGNPGVDPPQDKSCCYYCSLAKSCLTLCDPWTASCQTSLSSMISWSLLRFVSTESVMPSNHLILCHPLLLLPSILPSIRVFSNDSALCNRWPKYWSFSFSPSNEYLELVSFRIVSPVTLGKFFHLSLPQFPFW